MSRFKIFNQYKETASDASQVRESLRTTQARTIDTVLRIERIRRAVAMSAARAK